MPLAEQDQDAFVLEELTNYADEQIRDAGWSPAGALDRARAELLPVLERDFAEAREGGHDFWSAVAPDGTVVGWLWVQPDRGPGSAFLHQITVAKAFRRRGYGRSMLAAIERLLVQAGVEELLLNVNVRNVPARRFYAAAGYEQVGASARLCRMRKRLRPASRSDARARPGRGDGHPPPREGRA